MGFSCTLTQAIRKIIFFAQDMYKLHVWLELTQNCLPAYLVGRQLVVQT